MESDRPREAVGTHGSPVSRETMIRGIEAVVAETARRTGVARLDAHVREALARVPRERFVPEHAQSLAYANIPLAIGHGQTVSQPFIVALMTQLAGVSPGSRVLEIGTGSGYQAAVLGAIAAHVYSVEIVPELAETAAARLRKLDFDNVQVRCGDGFAGWPEAGPFDAILVTAAAPVVPPPLVGQLATDGRMVIPIGDPFGAQDLLVITKRADGTVETLAALPVAFVPLTRASADESDE